LKLAESNNNSEQINEQFCRSAFIRRRKVSQQRKQTNMLAKTKLTKKKNSETEMKAIMGLFTRKATERLRSVHSVVTINHLKRFSSKTGAK